MAKLKFGLAQAIHRAPAWLTNLTAILVILAQAKSHIIGGIPGIDESVKDIAYGWFDWVLDIAQVGSAMACVFIGRKKENPYL